MAGMVGEAVVAVGVDGFALVIGGVGVLLIATVGVVFEFDGLESDASGFDPFGNVFAGAPGTTAGVACCFAARFAAASALTLSVPWQVEF